MRRVCVVLICLKMARYFGMVARRLSVMIDGRCVVAWRSLFFTHCLLDHLVTGST